MNKEEIEAKYLDQHELLGRRRDADDPEEFDRQHRQIWANCDAELKVRWAELKAREILARPERLELVELEEMAVMNNWGLE